jgi:hypothetical protein
MRKSIPGSSIALLALFFPTAALAQLTIAPTTQSITNAGNSALYVVTITNPTASTQTFVPSANGNGFSLFSWGVQYPASVTVPAGASQNFNFVLTTPLGLVDGAYPFTVILTTAANLTYSTTGSLVVNSTSQTNAEIDTLNTTTVTQQATAFQVELKARMQGGSYLFDHTYNVAFSDPSITAAIAQAKSLLTGAGAVSFTGPTQLSSTQSTSSSTNTVQTGSQPTGMPTNTYTYTAPTTGPMTIYTGNRGICQSYSFPASAPPVLTGCSLTGTPIVFGPSFYSSGIFFVPEYDTDTLTVNLVTINQTATTTNTALTSQVYEIDGVAAGGATPATPAPPTLLLVLVGLALAGLYAARQPLRQALTRR